MAKQGKRMTAITAKLDRTTPHSLEDTLDLLKASATAKFDESVEVALNLGVDPRHADQQVRSMIQLPHGTGKSVRVAVFARDEKAEEARQAGADIVGAEDLMEQIQQGQMNFERCIATPDMMPIVGRLGKVLGPKGLMPNPKLGTVTPNVAEAVKAAKAGSVQFRTDKAGIIHAGVGKVSFSKEALKENIQALVEAVQKARPAGAKGTYMKKMTVSTTMGPGIRVDFSDVLSAGQTSTQAA